MKTTTKIILFTIVLTSILLSLGYAAIQNVTLNITGNVTADPNQSNFKVRFVRDVEPTVSDPVYATAGVTDDLNAVLNVNTSDYYKYLRVNAPGTASNYSVRIYEFFITATYQTVSIQESTEDDYDFYVDEQEFSAVVNNNKFYAFDR